MRTICLYFQVHQPFRFKRYRFFDIGTDHYYYDDYMNESIMRKVSDNCYLPANKILLQIIKEYGCKFKIAFSITGLALDQFELYAPEVIESFQKLAKTGCVEFLSETYSHSLVSLKDKTEFEKQVKFHSQRIKNYFGQEPKVFRNTELIYSDEIGAMIADLGFKAMLTEGAKHILGWKSPNYLYYNSINPRLKILLKNYKLSDDIAFRFSNRGWSEYPLTAEKYVNWLNNLDKKEDVINLFMDYETFGEHQWMDTGIFEFLKALPGTVFKNSSFTFSTPTEVAEKLQPIAPLSVKHPISWADEERDLTAWLGNELQEDAFNALYNLSARMDKCSDAKLCKDWRYLQASDHFYYMCTKFFSDGEVHAYFTPYESPYDAYINYMNVLSDFILRLDSVIPATEKDQQLTDLTSLLEEKDQLLKKYETELKKIKKSIKSSPAEKKNGSKIKMKAENNIKAATPKKGKQKKSEQKKVNPKTVKK